MHENTDINPSVAAEILDILLIDRTKNHHPEIAEKNIIWATDIYEKDFGADYSFFAPIKPHLLTINNENIIRPRTKKSKTEQSFRIKDKAEVFTPAWICNAQNNLIDEAWFSCKNVFNTENQDHTWTTNPDKIIFPEGKSWKDYVVATRLEISCGEASYLTSRYDSVTGEYIEVKNRIGLLDRKLRIVSENTETSGEWLKYAYFALQNIYGYEWQGDNLLIARQNVLLSFLENYKYKFGKEPLSKSVKYAAYIISWNLWQMDGLKFVIPESCYDEIVGSTLDLFGGEPEKRPCKGCETDDLKRHNGIHCLIRDWRKTREKQIVEFRT